MLRENYAQWHPKVQNVIWDGHFIEITSNCRKLNDLNRTAIMDLSEIWKIIIGNFEGGLIVNKITALSHCVGD